MAFTETKVRTVIEVLHDGEKGFASFSEKVTDPQIKSFFLEASSQRAKFATELESALSTQVGKDVKEGGTTGGAIHRVWGEIKGNLGGGDHTILETAEQGEDAAKKAYTEALASDDIPSNIKSILQKQQPAINASHDKVKAMRDSLKAA